MASEVNTNATSAPPDLSSVHSINTLHQEPSIRNIQEQEAANLDTPVNDLQKSGNRSTQRKFIAEASLPKINPPDLRVLQHINKLRDLDAETESAIETPTVRRTEANPQDHIQQGSRQIEAEKDKESSPKNSHEGATPLLRQEAIIKAMDDVNQAFDKAIQSVKGTKDKAEPLLQQEATIKAMDDVNQALDKAVQSVKGTKDMAEPPLRQKGAVKAIDDANQTPNTAMQTVKGSQETYESSSEQQREQEEAKKVVREVMQAYDKAIQSIANLPSTPAGQLVETEKDKIQSLKKDNETIQSYVPQGKTDTARPQAMQASKNPLSPVTPAQQQTKASDLSRRTKIAFKGFGTINVKSLKTLS